MSYLFTLLLSNTSWGEHLLFKNFQGCERGTAYNEFANAVPNFDMIYITISFDKMIKSTKRKNALVNFSRGLEEV